MEIQINGVTLEADFMDADFIAPYEEATKTMQTKAQACQKKKYARVADAIIDQCTVVDEYFDTIFGEGTAANIFVGSERNIMTHLKAVEELTKWAQGESKKLNDYTNKYTQRQQKKPYNYGGKKYKK